MRSALTNALDFEATSSRRKYFPRQIFQAHVSKPVMKRSVLKKTLVMVRLTSVGKTIINDLKSNWKRQKALGIIRLEAS